MTTASAGNGRPLRAEVSLRCSNAAWCGQPAELGVIREVESIMLASNGDVVEEIRLWGHRWPQAWQRMVAAPSTTSAELLESSPSQARARVRVRGCPYAGVLAQHGVQPRVPFVVADGRERWEIVASRQALHALTQDLSPASPGLRLLSVRPAGEPGGLTTRQREVLQAAVDAGYFEYPRRVSLTVLAQRLQMAKSSLTRTLRAAERAIIATLTGRP